MAKVSPTSDKRINNPAPPITLVRPSPFGAYEYVSITFTDAHRDVTVTHSLSGTDVGWIPLRIECLTGSPLEAPVVYANAGVGARLNTAGQLTLRCSAPNVRVTLLLTQER